MLKLVKFYWCIFHKISSLKDKLLKSAIPWQYLKLIYMYNIMYNNVKYKIIHTRPLFKKQ